MEVRNYLNFFLKNMMERFGRVFIDVENLDINSILLIIHFLEENYLTFDKTNESIVDVSLIEIYGISPHQFEFKVHTGAVSLKHVSIGTSDSKRYVRLVGKSSYKNKGAIVLSHYCFLIFMSYLEGNSPFNRLKFSLINNTLNKYES